MSLVGEGGTTIGWLGRSVGRGMVDRLLGANMVVVKVMLSMSLIAIVPLQLGLEGVVLLGEVLLPVVVGVAPPVAPLEGGRSRDVYILEVIISSIAPVGSRSWYGQTSSVATGAVWIGKWITGD